MCSQVPSSHHLGARVTLPASHQARDLLTVNYHFERHRTSIRPHDPLTRIAKLVPGDDYKRALVVHCSTYS